jgi:hypothetical protein
VISAILVAACGLTGWLLVGEQMFHGSAKSHERAPRYEKDLSEAHKRVY